MRRAFDYGPRDPVADVTIIYDGRYGQLNGVGLLDMQTGIVSKVWREAEDSSGVLPGSSFEHRNPAMV